MVDMIVMNLFVAISIEAYKKLAIDNTALKSNTPENQEPVADDPKVSTVWRYLISFCRCVRKF